MLVWILSQHIPKEWGAGGEDHFVGLYLVVVTRQRNIKEVLFFTKLTECNADVGFKVIPPETELFLRHNAARLLKSDQIVLAACIF